uniref:Uncharacterized protein n=1 Tax=Meloidogyne enterolobii TaxID=390850 RepID=A0A6V7WP70_MELEN|nr:unnamed protein product [Meloidogyne enterolobii]
MNRQGGNWEGVPSKEELKHFRLQNDFYVLQFNASQKTKFINELKEAQYTIGLCEMFHIGALMIFPLVGISTKNIVLTRTLPFDTHFYYLMGLNEKIISKNIPERRTLLDVGREALTQTGRIRDDYENEWNTNKIYYENAEKAFEIIYGNIGVEFKNFKDLIKETKYIFCNLQPKLDFKKVEEIFSRNRGALKEKVKFIGGIIATEPEPIKPVIFCSVTSPISVLLILCIILNDVTNYNI